jgi:tetratricopeptide (TPR) repeat protein
VLLPIGGFAQSEKSKLWDAYIAAGDKAYGEERYEIAEIMFRAARKEADYFGPHDHRVAITLFRLARLYETEGKLDQAEPLYEEAFEIWEKDSGPDPSDVASQINLRATTYYENGKYTDAVAFFEHARRIGKKKSELDLPTIGTVFSNIALVLSNQGNADTEKPYNDAEKLYKQVLAILQTAPDKETLDVPRVLIYLKKLNDKKDEADVEHLYKQALTTPVKDLGSRSLDFAILMNGLSRLYYTKKNLVKAEQVGNRGLEIQKEVLTPDNPSITTTQNSLAEIYFDEEKYAEAERLYKAVLATPTRTLGSASIDRASTLNALGRVYKKLENYPAAESTVKDALKILENSPNSEKVAETLNNLGHIYYLQNDYDKAEFFLKQVLVQKDLPDDRKRFYLNNLIVLYTGQKKLDQVELLLKQALISEKDETSTFYLDKLVVLYTEQKRYDKAELLLKQLSQKEKSEETRMLYLDKLVDLYMEQKRYAEAEPLLQQVIAFRIAYRDPSDLSSIFERYSTLLRNLNRRAAADEWHARAEAIRKNNPPQN